MIAMAQQGSLFPALPGEENTPPLTDEQRDIVSAISCGETLKVVALAGTGKTTTLLAGAHAVPNRCRVLYLAFNKSTQMEAKAKFPVHVDCRTAHSLAHGAAMGHFGRGRLNPSLMAVVRAIEALDEVVPAQRYTGGESRSAAMVVARTLYRWAQSDRREASGRDVPPGFGFALGEQGQRAARADVASAARRIWQRILEPDSLIPIIHDFYLKFWALQDPTLPYDLVMFDEAQDANPVMLSVVVPQGAQQVYVGDTHQSIYQFRGAVDAMKSVPGKALALTKSWRFGPQIARQANEVLDLLGEPLRVVGGGSAGVIMDDPHDLDADAVLCRGNAGVVHEVLAGLDAGERVAVVGGVEDAARLMEAAYELWCGGAPRHPEIGIFLHWNEFEEFSETEEGSTYKPVVRLVKDHRHGVPALCRRLKMETVKEPDANLVVSTSHKAKGREWPSVRLHDDFPPLVDCDQDGRVRLRREEANLVYVSGTRAQRRLNLAGYGAQLRTDAARLRAG